MTTDNHYFIEENADGKFAVRAKSSHRGSTSFNTPRTKPKKHVRQLNPDDKPNVERVRNRETGDRDKGRGGS